MKKMLFVLVSLLMVFLLVGTSYGLVIKGRPYYCFDWVNDNGEGRSNGQLVHRYVYSSCFTPTSESNIVAFAYKMSYTEYGRGYLKVPAGVSYSIVDVALNLSTNQVNEYALADYDFNGNLIKKYSYLENGDLDPKLWRNIKPDSVGDLIVKSLKNRSYCGPCR